MQFYGIFGKVAVGKTVEHRQQIGRSFPGACLCHGNKIAAFKGHRYGLLLNRRAVAEAHGVESVEHVVVEVVLVESHNRLKAI